jgi:hypothetical protein
MESKLNLERSGNGARSERHPHHVVEDARSGAGIALSVMVPFYDEPTLPVFSGGTTGMFRSKNLGHGRGARATRYDYFKSLKPAGWIGYTLVVYHMTPQDAAALRDGFAKYYSARHSESTCD